MPNEKCCGTCRHHRRETTAEWVCDNEDSEYYADYTEYGDECEEWEDKNSAEI